MSRLYMVATPIGNMEDITYRAVRVLGEVDVIACEDTRHTSLLLSRYGISKRLISCHSHNEIESSKGILNLLDQGYDVAYCSDAGSPGISDPGERLVEYIRENSDHDIIPIPGVSALTSLVSVSGNIGKAFAFEGFLPLKSGKRGKRLRELIERGDSFIIYESPYRVLKTLEEISKIGGVKRVVIGREMTKAFEEIITGTIDSVICSLRERDSIKGEFSILIVPAGLDDNAKEDIDS